ncbi:hypothetical protein N9O61_01060 [Octadecabacter sp.]|nr:hypothetical protein [Octadecabacter sp.]
MIDISKSIDVYRALLEVAPNDRFSAAHFDSGREGPGSAYAVLLEKPVDLPPASALSLLWSREFIFIEEWDLDGSQSIEDIWEDALSGDYMIKEFKRFVTLGAFSPIAPTVAKNRIRSLLQQVRFVDLSGTGKPYKSFSERSIGRITSLEEFHDRLTGFEYLQAFEVANDWNGQSYFFETNANVGYFSWGTSA